MLSSRGRTLARPILARRGRGLATHKYAFDQDVAVTPESSGKKGGYVAHINRRWSIGDAPNGGYLTSIAITAARKELTLQDPLSVSVHFVSKTREADADVWVKVLNSGRTTQTCEVSISQEGKLRSQYLMTFGSLAHRQGMSYSTLSAPELPPVESTIEAMGHIHDKAGDTFRLGKMLALHISPKSSFAQGALRGKRVSDARIEGWVAFKDGRPPCLRSMALFNDGYPPSVLNLTPSPWVPTLELTTHFWNRPPKGTDAPKYLRARFVTSYVTEGLVMADSEVWSHDGLTLYSTSRQLAKILQPPASTSSSSKSAASGFVGARG